MQIICRYDDFWDFRHYFRGVLLSESLKKGLFCGNNPLYMKKQLGFLCVLIAANFFIYSSCNKSDYTPPVPKTKTQLLTQSTWKFKSATVSGSPYTIQACQQDNIYTFASAGTGNVDEGPSKCNTSDPQNTPFTWSFQSNETILLLSTPLFSGGASSITLVSLSETELVVSFPYNPTPFISVIVVITFQH
jgi:Lipocalin-like domain